MRLWGGEAAAEALLCRFTSSPRRLDMYFRTKIVRCSATKNRKENPNGPLNLGKLSISIFRTQIEQDFRRAAI